MTKLYLDNHSDNYWDVNRNRAPEDFIPTDIKELELEIKRLQDRLDLCKNVHERLSKKSQNKS